MRLPDDQRALLASAGGHAALQLLMPLLRAVAMYLDGVGRYPPELAHLPQLKSDLEMERLAQRAARNKARALP